MTDRQPTAIPNISVTADGTMVCTRCGASYKSSDVDVVRFNTGPGLEFCAKHKDCKPRVYVS